MNKFEHLTTYFEQKHAQEELIFPSKRVLFVCWANAGRSQIAQGIFSTAYPYVEVESAGVGDYSHKYEHPHPLVIAEMARHGIDISQNRVKQITEAMITPETDVVALCDPTKLPPFVTQMAQSVLGIPVRDPYTSRKAPIASENPLAIGIRHTYEKLDFMIQNHLLDIMKAVRENGFTRLTQDGIIYPYAPKQIEEISPTTYLVTPHSDASPHNAQISPQ